MAWIRTVSPDEADGRLAKYYEESHARAGRVFQIVQSMSLAPSVLNASMALYREVTHSPGGLSRSSCELIAVIVSVVNECHY